MLDGTHVVVTGAAGEIGAAIVEKVRAYGGIAHAWDRVVAPGVTAVDVTDRAAIAAAMDEISENNSVPFGIVNAAGIVTYVPFLDLTPADWSRMIDVNLTGIFNVTQIWAQARVNRKLPGGSVVNITSIAARIASSGLNVHYAASKGGADALTRGLAIGLAEHGIRVNAVAPGPVKTQMNKVKWDTPEKLAKFQGRVVLGRLGAPVEIAEATAFLLSERSSWTTGATLFVDGGLTARN